MGNNLCHYFWGSPSEIPSKRIIQLPNGCRLRGKAFAFNVDGHLKEVDAFLNIPFGKAPIGPLRFKRPEPADPWPLDQILECTRFGPRCPHEDMPTERIHGLFQPKSEDCLNLNVFTPAYNSPEWEKTGYPVMVFIHGGGFAVHSASHYGDHNICSNLCLKDVIVVTIQYRLGFFGFLCTADENAPGNMGLWDQTLALKWVKDNISSFGGDPLNITVFGQSAGGASTDLLALSPHSRDLFQKMIPMSGSASCTFATNDAEHVRDSCLKFAIQSGFQWDSADPPNVWTKKLMDYFCQLPARSLELNLFGKRGFHVNSDGMLDITPVYDNDFLPKHIDELRLEAPLKSIMMGISIKPPKTSLKHDVEKVISREFHQHKVEFTESHKEYIENLYFNKEEKEGSTLNKPNISHKEMHEIRRRKVVKAYIKVASDLLINNGVWNAADRYCHHGNTVYLYSFDYYNPNGFGIAGFFFPFKGATHCSEIPYLFNKGIIANFHPNANDLEIMHRFSTYFTNFAKYGNPNDNKISDTPHQKMHWEPLHPSDTHKYFSIRLKDSGMRENFCDRLPLKWRNILSETSKTTTNDL